MGYILFAFLDIIYVSIVNVNLDIGEWIITMTEAHGKKQTRKSTFVMESINKAPIKTSKGTAPGAISNILLRSKYKGMKF